MKEAKLWTIKVLNDYKDLRNVNKRKELVKKVWEVSGVEFSPETICRTARKLQNEMGMFLPDDIEKNEVLKNQFENEYINFFVREKE